MKPIIGLSANTRPANDPKRSFNVAVGIQYIQDYYCEFIRRGGGVPIILPLLETEAEANSLARRIDGLILTGGEDVDPKLYQEDNLDSRDVDPRRDHSELLLIRALREQSKAILGICRGIQILNAALGGTNYQDLATQVKGVLDHPLDENLKERFHQVQFTGESVLTEIFGQAEIRTNSSHHQAVHIPGEHLQVLAQAPDGVIEAVRHTQDRCTLGVQWHPERMLDQESVVAFSRWFITQAQTA